MFSGVPNYSLSKRSDACEVVRYHELTDQASGVSVAIGLRQHVSLIRRTGFARFAPSGFTLL